MAPSRAQCTRRVLTEGACRSDHRHGNRRSPGRRRLSRRRLCARPNDVVCDRALDQAAGDWDRGRRHRARHRGTHPPSRLDASTPRVGAPAHGCPARWPRGRGSREMAGPSRRGVSVTTEEPMGAMDAHSRAGGAMGPARTASRSCRRRDLGSTDRGQGRARASRGTCQRSGCSHG